jgi:hypothetical protein
MGLKSYTELRNELAAANGRSWKLTCPLLRPSPTWPNGDIKPTACKLAIGANAKLRPPSRLSSFHRNNRPAKQCRSRFACETLR